MKASTRRYAIAGMCTVAGIGIVFSTAVSLLNRPEPAVEAPRPLLIIHREFVCYSDGKLVERHVGVSRTFFQHPSQWTVVYTDGGYVHYIQSAGESCGVEKYHDDLAP